MALSRIATALGGLLLSRGGRRFAGRHAGKLALATLAFELWQSRRTGVTPGPKMGAGATPPPPKPHPRRRWSGRPS
ncbi:MAG: cysteine protease [Alphaproteobacteria bacterium]|nr:cysteine protease [Alphaproteobacteria bacterium]MBU2380624.1 cysteine protease [Alphaproteobacteria bacterium]